MNILSVITQILILMNAVTNTAITVYRVKKVMREKENSTLSRPKQKVELSKCSNKTR